MWMDDQNPFFVQLMGHEKESDVFYLRIKHFHLLNFYKNYKMHGLFHLLIFLLYLIRSYYF